MQAIIVKAPGGVEQLELQSVPDPVLSPHDVLIEVHAAGLNRADLLQRRGLYPPPAGESEVLGLECAGVVVAVGREVSRAQIGDRVMALLPGGGYAELARVHEHLLMKMPERLSFEEAAAVPEAFLTSYEVLLQTAALAPGERVLIHAGASGVGSAAVQIAHQLGAYVLATTKGEAKLETVQKLGANCPIDYSREDFCERVLVETRQRGVDVIADLVGAAYAERNQAALASGGRWVVVGLLGGTRATIDLSLLLTRRQTITGVVMRSRPVNEKAAIVRGFERDLGLWLAEGRLQPLIDSVVPLEQVASAHQRMEANSNIGKIVLKVR